jgi:hypothetical protein
MRYHSARVVLGACLVAATAAAQAPATSSSSAATRGLDSFERAPAGDAFGVPRRLLVDPDDQEQGQGEGPYTLRSMFRSNHGEFMDRRERFHPDLNFRVGLIPNEKIVGEPGHFDLINYEFDGAVKMLVSPDGYFTLGGYYSARRYVTSSAFGTKNNASGIPDETLVATGARLGFGVFLRNDLLLEMETRPGVWSDLGDTLKHQDYDFPSSMLFTWQTAAPNFFFKFGARYNQVYKDAPWLPYIGFGWEVTEGLRIDLLAPESLEISWWPDQKLGFMWGAEVTGAEYRVHTPEVLNQSDNVRVQEVVSYLGLMSRPNDYVSFMVRGGVVISGYYDLTTGAAGFDHAEGSLGQAAFADFTFGISF